MVDVAPGIYLHRLGIDFLLYARHAIFGPLFPPEQSSVVVVVIDEETYRTPPFSDTPKVAWTPMLARVLDKLNESGARVVGFDLIYPTTLDSRNLLPGFDKPLLKSFYKLGRAGPAGRAGRLVLGETRLSRQTIRPYRGQVIAVGGPKNIRPLNLLLDADDVVRGYPAAFPTEGGGRVASFAAELAVRSGIPAPTGDFLINYNTGARDIPTYSLADMFHCATSGNDEFYARAFGGKTVLVGSSLDLEDRHMTAKRFVNALDDGAPPRRCKLPYVPDRFGEIIQRHTLPGIFIHAAAFNSLARGDALVLLSPVASFGLMAGMVFILSMLLFLMAPVPGFFLTLGAIAFQGGASVFAFQSGVVLPLVLAALGGLVTFAAIYAFRMMLEDRAKRRIKKAFGQYLAPSIVERLSQENETIELGGETRRVTVMFTDIAGYTKLAERLKDQPELLVTILNRYFTVLTGVIEDHGGYVVSFIGDAVMASWGAPSVDPLAERHAVEAGLVCLEKLAAFNRDVMEGEYGLPPIGTRFGINSGDGLVGNTGSATRLNYTVTGDTTNLAARLEGANKIYGSNLMIGEETARRLGREFVLRRLDRLLVVGKSKPTKVYEVVGRAAEISDDRLARVRDFHDAMAQYYRRRFARARDDFAKLAIDDPIARVYSERCSYFEENPPPATWDHSFTAETK